MIHFLSSYYVFLTYNFGESQGKLHLDQHIHVLRAGVICFDHYVSHYSHGYNAEKTLHLLRKTQVRQNKIIGFDYYSPNTIR